MLHVGGLVHSDRQLDLELSVLTVLWDHHPVEVGLFWSIGGGVQDHLRGHQQAVSVGQFLFGSETVLMMRHRHLTQLRW